MSGATAPTARNGQLASDGATGTINVTLRVAGKDITRSLATTLRADVDSAVAGTDIGVTPADQLATVLDQDTNRRAELIGLLAALVILLVAFGSIAAALLPLGVAIVGLAVAVLGLGLLGHALDIPTVAPSLASMIGLGVGIDYSLFGLNRFQRALIDGESPVGAATTTSATAGRAVLFAALSVIAALSGLALVGMPLMRSLAIASGLAVLVACTGVGDAAARLPVVAGAATRDETSRVAGRRRRVGATRLRRRASSVDRAVGSVVVLGVLAAPALDLRLGQLDSGSWPTQHARRASPTTSSRPVSGPARTARCSSRRSTPTGSPAPRIRGRSRWPGSSARHRASPT